jgi:hypothetical protein
VIAISSVTRLEPIRKVVKGRATKEKCHLRERRRKKDDKNREKEKGMKDFMIWEVQQGSNSCRSRHTSQAGQGWVASGVEKFLCKETTKSENSKKKAKKGQDKLRMRFNALRVRLVASKYRESK